MVAVLLIALASSLLGCSDQIAGSAGLGDPYFPQSGNGGYDALHYDLALEVDPASGALQGVAAVAVEVTQALDSLNLDLRGLDVSAVKVDGAPARFDRSGQELKVELPARAQAGERVTLEVAYAGTPESLKDPGGEDLTLGWQHADDTVFTVDEPVGAATWYPVNDHPSDKATYAFHITVPAAYTAVANGVLKAVEDSGSDRVFTWEMEEPLASYLAAVGVGRFTLQEASGPAGVAIRNYFAESLSFEAAAAFAATGEVMTYFVELFGPYPFSAYGVLVPAADTGAAMENQTMSLFGRDLLRKRMSDPLSRDVYLAHELAHQWFGDSVTPSSWKDIWLNEGFATYASWLWLERSRGGAALTDQVQQARVALAQSGGSALTDLDLENLFGEAVYLRGALTLHALRLTVGDELFFAVLRAWADQYRHTNATTEDFIALAQSIVGPVGTGEGGGESTPGSTLIALFEAWLGGGDPPELPAVAH